jgi:hypothetical protein
MSALAYAPALFDHMGGEPTLDDLIVSAWEGLATHAVVACPVCAGEMESIATLSTAGESPAGHSRLLGGRCKACGSALS